MSFVNNSTHAGLTPLENVSRREDNPRYFKKNRQWYCPTCGKTGKLSYFYNTQCSKQKTKRQSK